MKVCIVTSVFPRYENDLEVPWLREIVKRCRAHGADVHVFAPAFRGLRSHSIEGIPVKRFRYFFAPWETLTHEEGAPNKIHKLHYKLITVFYILSGCLGLIRYHLRENFDILHVHWPFPHTFFALAARRFRPAKLVLNFYGADLLLIRKYGWVKRYLTRFVEKADAVAAISNFTAAQVRALRDTPVTIVAYGAAVTMKAPSAGRVTSVNDIVLTAGRTIERKGFEFLIRAMPLVRAKVPDATLQLVGDGPLRPGLRKLVSQLGAEEYISLPGKISNEALDDLFARCSVFVLPSVVDSKGDTEGLGVVLLEAMMYRKAVVASDVGGIPDVVTHDKTGLLVPQKDVPALAEAICRLLRDAPLARRLGEAGFLHVNARFSWEVIVRRVMEVYQGCYVKNIV